MASSLSPRCTPLKLKYDACFNAWLEDYLESTKAGSATFTPEREALTKQKAEEYNTRCGKVWEDYKQCVQVYLCDSYIANTIADERRVLYRIKG
jgi:TRIAP1/MDM35 family protein